MMCRRICFLLWALIICLSGVLCIQISAESSDTATSSSIFEDKSSIWENISLEFVAEKPRIEPIFCFDVSVDGQVAIGFQGSSVNRISVYSNGGQFLYCYEFKCNGNFYVYWEQENICIYFVRARMVVTVDPHGRCVDVRDAEDAGIDSNDLKRIMSSSKQVNGTQYYLENDMIIGAEFGRLCVQNADGTESVFYDATELHNARVIVGIVAVVLFYITATFFTVKRLSGRAKMKGELDT